jgi:hypothetical protein
MSDARDCLGRFWVVQAKEVDKMVASYRVEDELGGNYFEVSLSKEYGLAIGDCLDVVRVHPHGGVGDE